MKIAVLVLFFVLLIAVVALFFLGKKSESGEVIGLIEGKLARCPETPNCVCSEYADDVSHHTEPLAGSMDIQTIEKVLNDIGGSVHERQGNYLAATFTSRLFGFVDDVEIRVDIEQNILHLRSASRVGRGDMGVNRKRILKLKALLNESQ